jgi:O-antigen/teichoic acid export membrane protein
MSIRAISLLARFGLTIYLARYLDLAAIGIFGLVAGVAGITPALIGFGINYYMNREIVDAPMFNAALKVRDRLLVTALTLTVAVLVAVLCVFLGLFKQPPLFALLVAIVFLECIAFDIHLSLISMSKPLLANFLLFVRSAGWIGPVIVIGIAIPSSRTLQSIFLFWFAGLNLNFLMLWLIVRGSISLRHLLRPRVDFAWLRSRIIGGWLIYANDIGMAGQIYLDRFIVSHLLGLTMTGLYTLYWSIANSIHVLVTTAVTQLALPHLIKSHRTSRQVWRSMLMLETVKAFAIGIALCCVIAFAVLYILPELGLTQFSRDPLLFVFMCAGICVRLISDMVNYGLYSRGQDREFALTNVFGIVLSAGLSFACIVQMGVHGVGLSMILTPSILLILRLISLRRGASSRPGKLGEGVSI